ncbi:MAG: LacI family DNA-binding transcriptional regulator [Phycisphaerae bacterium]|nr:LacI family DNA-binding transcriptional regulator [Phycisphaerae bacterium]
MVTIYDIAQKVGTTHATVSRALRNDQRISAKTRARIQAVAKRLNYRPNVLARGLSGGRTQALGVLWDFAPYMPSGEMARRIATDAQKRGVVPYIADTTRNIEVILGMLHEFANRGVDGVVVQISGSIEVNRELTESLRQFRAAMLVTREELDIEMDQVVHDRMRAVQQAADCFIQSGRTRPGMAIPLSTTAKKLSTFVEEVRHCGLDVPPEAILDIGTEEQVGRHCYELLRSRFPDGRVPFDSLFCSADEIAIAAISWLKTMRIRVPEDVAVIGFNDSEGGRFFDPPLASVDRKDQQVSEAIDRMIHQRLEHPDLPVRREVIEMEFVRRRSAG